MAPGRRAFTAAPGPSEHPARGGGRILAPAETQFKEQALLMEDNGVFLHRKAAYFMSLTNKNNSLSLE